MTAGSEDAASGQVRQPDDSTAEQIGDVAEQVGDSAVLEAVARVGLVAYGVVYLLIGWLALRIASGKIASRVGSESGRKSYGPASPITPRTSRLPRSCAAR